VNRVRHGLLRGVDDHRRVREKVVEQRLHAERRVLRREYPGSLSVSESSVPSSVAGDRDDADCAAASLEVADAVVNNEDCKRTGAEAEAAATVKRASAAVRGVRGVPAVAIGAFVVSCQAGKFTRLALTPMASAIQLPRRPSRRALASPCLAGTPVAAGPGRMAVVAGEDGAVRFSMLRVLADELREEAAWLVSLVRAPHSTRAFVLSKAGLVAFADAQDGSVARELQLPAAASAGDNIYYV